MAKPPGWDLEIIFVPDCQAVSGAAGAGTTLPVSLWPHSTQGAKHRHVPGLKSPTPSWVHVGQAVLGP